MRPKKCYFSSCCFVFFFLRFRQNEKRNELINLINLPWKGGFIKISVYCRPFLRLRNLFPSIRQTRKKEKRMSWKDEEENEIEQWDFNIRFTAVFERIVHILAPFVTHTWLEHIRWISFSYSFCNDFSATAQWCEKKNLWQNMKWNGIKLNSLFSTDFQFSILVRCSRTYFCFLLFWLNSSSDH